VRRRRCARLTEPLENRPVDIGHQAPARGRCRHGAHPSNLSRSAPRLALSCRANPPRTRHRASPCQADGDASKTDLIERLAARLVELGPFPCPLDPTNLPCNCADPWFAPRIGSGTGSRARCFGRPPRERTLSSPADTTYGFANRRTGPTTETHGAQELPPSPCRPVPAETPRSGDGYELVARPALPCASGSPCASQSVRGETGAEPHLLVPRPRPQAQAVSLAGGDSERSQRLG